jgi:enoyl-CoA hydratase/carnithine racemase
VKAVVVTGAGGNFCSGGDVHEIIGPLTKMSMPELLEFTRMTGDLVKTMRNCPQPVIGAIDGICAGAGAMMALACDMRLGTPPRRPPSCSHAWAWPVPTWAPAHCCHA